MALVSLAVQSSVVRVRPARPPRVPDFVIYLLVRTIFGMATALRIGSIVVVRPCGGMATMAMRPVRSSGWRMRSVSRSPRTMRSLPIAVLFLLPLQVFHLLVEPCLLPPTEFLEACYRVDAAYSGERDRCKKKNSSVVTLLFVQVLVKAHDWGSGFVRRSLRNRGCGSA